MAWRMLLLPLSPLYRGAVNLRKVAYRRGWFQSERLDVPVISVGNISFGGTGKTPTVIALVRELARMGRRPAVLTRGYRRHSRDPIVVIGPEPLQRVEEIGDEPMEIARRLPGVPVVVDADRVRGGQEAVRLGANVLVLDDGFQHLRLERDLDLVLLDAGDPWGGRRMPPRGRLREPLSGLSRASAVLVTKVPADSEHIVGEIKAELAKIAPGKTVISTRLKPSRVRTDGKEWKEPESLSGQRVFAFAGLGRPQGFETLLVDAGAEVEATRWFPDHHDYTPEEIESVIAEAIGKGAIPVTTAKDAVKLPPDAPIWMIEVEMEPVAGTWDQLWRVRPGMVS